MADFISKNTRFKLIFPPESNTEILKAHTIKRPDMTKYRIDETTKKTIHYIDINNAITRIEITPPLDLFEEYSPTNLALEKAGINLEEYPTILMRTYVDYALKEIKTCENELDQLRQDDNIHEISWRPDEGYSICIYNEMLDFGYDLNNNIILDDFFKILKQNNINLNSTTLKKVQEFREVSKSINKDSFGSYMLAGELKNGIKKLQDYMDSYNTVFKSS